MLSGTDFSPVSMADRQLFLSHYRKFPQVHSDNTFSNMICWNPYAHYRYAHVRKNLLISSTIKGKTSFRTPIGPRDRGLLADLLNLCTREGDVVPLWIVDAADRDWILYRVSGPLPQPGSELLRVQSIVRKILPAFREKTTCRYGVT